MIRKDKVILRNAYYNTPKTILNTFHFSPHPYPETESRLEKVSAKNIPVDERDVWILDDFYTEKESEDLRNFAEKSSFSMTVYSSEKSHKANEKPARSMDSREKWHFFSKPPLSVQRFFELLSVFSKKLDADVALQPWNLSGAHSFNASAIVMNRIEEVSPESEEVGKHSDYMTEKGLSFGIRKHFGKEEYHEDKFINGARGKPYLLTAMIYATSKDFDPSYGMGTGFYKKNGEKALFAACRDMRMVFFEGDVVHSLERSNIPEGKDPWRISYVFKLFISPYQADQSIKEDFRNLFTQSTE